MFSWRQRRALIQGIGIAVLIAALPSLSAGQPGGAARSIVFVLDNDLIAVRGAGVPPDHDYTHGAIVSLGRASAPGFVRRAFGRKPGCQDRDSRRLGCLAATTTLGQAIYTPRRDAAEPVPGERPYAGWLYASMMVHMVRPGRARSFGAEVGVTGPASLAEPVQEGAHRLLRNEPQLGWEHQLRNGPGVALRYSEVRRTERPVGDVGVGGLALRWGANVGTVGTTMSAGAEGSLGTRGDLPWSPSQPEFEHPTRWYALVGYRQDAVLRSALIEGRGESGRAERRVLVGQVEAGVGY